MDRAALSARVTACFLAGALGDAWGRPFEGRTGLGTPDFPARPQLSDDTLLTLATCDALVRTQGVVTAETIAETFREWFVAGRLHGLGSSTLKALRDLAAGAHWALSGARGEFAAGSGAAMRAAPLAFLLDPAEDDDRVRIRDVSRITHHSEEAYAGALAVIAAIRLCVRASRVPSDLLEAVAAVLPDTRVRDRILELQGCSGSAEAAARFGRSGYVVEAVPLALFIATASKAGTLAETVQQAVSLGGDSDTIAAIAGQLSGAAGLSPPLDLVGRIAGIREVEAVVERFAALAARDGDPR